MTITPTPLVVDTAHLGTPEGRWLAPGVLDVAAPMDPVVDLGPIAAVVVVAPHPDDEVIGPGATVSTLSAAGVAVHLVAVTDGEGSHPASPTVTPPVLAARRAEETSQGLRRLGVDPASAHRLGVADGGVSAAEAVVAEALAAAVTAARPSGTGRVAVLAPWAHDGHCDHDSCGRAARAVAELDAEVVLLEYLVWAWHWATPEGGEIPLASGRRVLLDRRRAATKRWATAAYRSQIRPLSPAAGDEVVLPGPVLRRAWRRSEVLLPYSPVPSGGHRQPRGVHSGAGARG